MSDTTPTRTPRSSSPWWRASWVLPALLVVVAVVFVLENRDPVSIRLLVPVVVMPQWAALTITLVIGVLVGLLVRRRRHHR